tara:strand:+ start:511 stop:969 length:459 start_codon:yes stop_codon:yes gene_type:complete
MAELETRYICIRLLNRTWVTQFTTDKTVADVIGAITDKMLRIEAVQQAIAPELEPGRAVWELYEVKAATPVDSTGYVNMFSMQQNRKWIDAFKAFNVATFRAKAYVPRDSCSVKVTRRQEEDLDPEFYFDPQDPEQTQVAATLRPAWPGTDQ